MNTGLVRTVPASFPQQAETDEHLIRLWLHGRSPATVEAYTRDIDQFGNSVRKPLRSITVGDIQQYADSLLDLASATQSRKLASLKSLIGFGHKLGYLPFDVGAPVRLSKTRNALAERIISEGDVLKMIALETNPRNHAILMVLYGGGLRASELVGLRWKDVGDRGEALQLTIDGKGGKTRFVLLSISVSAALREIGADADEGGPVFAGRYPNQPLSRQQVHRIVKAAAKRAGLKEAVSSHWLRHAHASHSMDRGAPAHLVMSTLGHASLSTTSGYSHARPDDGSGRYLAV